MLPPRLDMEWLISSRSQPPVKFEVRVNVKTAYFFATKRNSVIDMKLAAESFFKLAMSKLLCFASGSDSRRSALFSSGKIRRRVC